MLKRKGKFRLSRAVLENHEKGLLEVFGSVIILRAEYIIMDDYFNYDAVSMHFDELEEGQVIPEYLPIIERNIEGCKSCGNEKFVYKLKEWIKI